MKLDDLMLSVDDEQEMTVCILASNRTDVLHKISGDCGSIRKMIKTDLENADIASIVSRDKNIIWVWLEVRGE